MPFWWNNLLSCQPSHNGCFWLTSSVQTVELEMILSAAPQHRLQNCTKGCLTTVQSMPEYFIHLKKFITTLHYSECPIVSSFRGLRIKPRELPMHYIFDHWLFSICYLEQNGNLHIRTTTGMSGYVGRLLWVEKMALSLANKSIIL